MSEFLIFVLYLIGLIIVFSYIYFTVKVCELGELFNINWFVTFGLCLVFTSFLVFIVLMLIDDIKYEDKGRIRIDR